MKTCRIAARRWGDMPADDAPPYIAMLVVLHFVALFVVFFYKGYYRPGIVMSGVLLVLLVAALHGRVAFGQGSGHRYPAETRIETREAVMTEGRGRLTRIVLEGEALHRLSALQEADRDQAVEDLREENSFFPDRAAGAAKHPAPLHPAGPPGVRYSRRRG